MFVRVLLLEKSLTSVYTCFTFGLRVFEARKSFY